MIKMPYSNDIEPRVGGVDEFIYIVSRFLHLSNAKLPIVVTEFPM